MGNVMADNTNSTSIDEHFISKFIFSYNQLSHPAKADKSEIEKYLNFLEMLPRHQNILIIGASPELRDIAFLTDKNVTCCDASACKLQLMKKYHMKYGKYIGDNAEELIACNPLKMGQNEKICKQKYDLILSVDMHLNMLPFEEWQS